MTFGHRLQPSSARPVPEQGANLQGMLLQVQVARVDSVMQDFLCLWRQPAACLAAELAKGSHQVAPH